MTDPYHSKPGPRPGSGGPAKPTSAPAGPTASKDSESSGGKVVHDARGNAVWQWVKDTGRHAIESTSALLKKLEVPELTVEEPAAAQEVVRASGHTAQCLSTSACSCCVSPVGWRIRTSRH
jgi:hypothetical protein